MIVAGSKLHEKKWPERREKSREMHIMCNDYNTHREIGRKRFLDLFAAYLLFVCTMCMVDFVQFVEVIRTLPLFFFGSVSFIS